jgi:hypothetical protein
MSVLIRHHSESLPGRAVLLILVAAVVSTVVAEPAPGQCTLASGPASFIDPGTFPPLKQLSTGFTFQVLPYLNGTRLVTGTNWAYGVYDLTSPTTPQLVGWDSLNDSIGPKRGDGQNYFDRLGISADGQRFLVSLSSAGSVAHGNTLVYSPGTRLFTAGGDFGKPQASGAVVQHVGGRYIAYTISSNGFIAADVTTLPGYVPALGVSGPGSPSVLNVPSEVAAFPSGAGTRDLTLSSQYLIYLGGANVVIIDASNPGPVGSITSGYPSWQLSPTDFGRPAGEYFLSIGAAADPSVPTQIYVVGEFASAGVSTGFTLLQFNRSTASHTIVGSFVPPVPFSGAGSLPGLSVTLQPAGTDVLVTLWAKTSTGGAGGGRALRLYATTVRDWASLTPASSPVIQIDAATNPNFTGVSQTALVPGAGADVYAYVATGANAYALQLSCATGPVPAIGHLSVSNVSGGSSVPLTSGATVFVGDTLQVTPSVTPSDASFHVDQWNLDFDYHSATETGAIGLLQLLNPDACFTGCANSFFPANPDPPPFAFVGPCDPRSGGSPSTGNSCWNSVVANNDFASAQPAAGTTASLSTAFEAQNSLNTTTVTLATFNITWKVPAVKVQSLASLLDSNSRATFTDGSDGHPVNYKWYFGSTSGDVSGTPPPPTSEPLTQDTTGAGCNGTASCQHTFPGKGTYNAWLTATYKNGYASPDCGPPCTLPIAGSFIVTVTDFVAAFAAPPTAYIGGGGINITNKSQIGAGITVNGYQYSLCDASQVPCQNDQAVYQDLAIGAPPSGAGTISPVPSAPGTYWLRIKATYGSGSTAQWLPNVSGVSDPKAWPIDVQAVPPTIRGISGVTVSPFGSYVTKGQPATVALYVGGGPSGQTANWIATGGSVTPTSASGVSSFTFTAQSATVGNVVISVDAPGVQPLSLAVYDPTPPPSTGPSVTLGASPGSPAPGQSVALTAYASGGSGSYTNYAFTFGDGQSASGPYSSATHSYANAGTYTARCTVTDSQGKSGSGSVNVSVGGGGGGSISVSVAASPSSAGIGIPIALTASASGGSGTYPTYTWNFGDETPPFSGPYALVTHAYASAGSYSPRCTVTDSASASGIGSTTVTIGAAAGPPDFRIAYPGGTDAVLGTDGSFLVVQGQQNTFRAVSNTDPRQPLTVTSPSWNWGDGTTSSTNPATKAWSTGGTYPVILTVPGQAPVTHNVNVVGGIPTGAYTYYYSVNGDAGDPVDPTHVAPGAGILFKSSGPQGAEYYWDFGDGTDCQTDPASPCASVTSHEFASPGSYTVVLTVTLGGNSFSTPAPTTFNVVDLRWIVPGLALTSKYPDGSYYVSDVVIQNPSATGWAIYSVALLDGPEPPDWHELAMFQPGESRRISNVLKTVFGKSAPGAYAMVVRGDSVPTGADPIIWAFTYDVVGGDGTHGTFGVAIPGVPVSAAAGPASPPADREFPGLRDAPLTALPNISPAYTNIGFVNSGNVPATVNVSFYLRDDEGVQKLGNSFLVDVGANETRQLTKSLTQALAGTENPYETYLAGNYFMAFEVVGDGAKVVPYASVKDVGSSDSIFLTSAPNIPAGQIRIPSVVRVNSPTGDRFRSRVVIFNPSALDRTVKLVYSYRRCPAGGACDDRAEMAVTTSLASGGTILADDFVKAWFANFGFAVSDTDNYIQSYLDVMPADGNTDPLVVRGETYNSQPNGNFGTQVPGLVPEVHGASAGGSKTRLTIPYVVPRSGGSGSRTNVAFVALGDAPAQATVRLHQPSDGARLPTARDEVVTVDDKFLQLSLEKLFPELADFPENPAGYYSVEIEVTSGTMAAFAVVNDNITSDGSLILAQPLPPLAPLN